MLRCYTLEVIHCLKHIASVHITFATNKKAITLLTVNEMESIGCVSI